MRKLILATVLAFVITSVPSFAGPYHKDSQQSSQTSQQSSQQSSQCAQQSGSCHNKPGVMSKIKTSFKNGYQKGKVAGTKAHDSIQNKVMDTGVNVKEKLTGKKDKTFVKGYYTKDGKHVNGHWRELNQKAPCKK